MAGRPVRRWRPKRSRRSRLADWAAPPSVAFGGALAFVSVLLVLVCAGLTVMQQRPEPRGRDGGAERLLEEMIERELR